MLCIGFQWCQLPIARAEKADVYMIQDQFNQMGVSKRQRSWGVESVHWREIVVMKLC